MPNNNPTLPKHINERSKISNNTGYEGSLGFSEEISLAYSPNNKDYEQCAPAIETLFPFGNTPPVYLLSTNGNASLGNTCKTTSERANDNMKHHVNAVNDALCNHSYS